MYRYTCKKSGHLAAFSMNSYFIEQLYHEASIQMSNVPHGFRYKTSYALYSVITNRFFSQCFFKLGLFAMGDPTARC